MVLACFLSVLIVQGELAQETWIPSKKGKAASTFQGSSFLERPLLGLEASILHTHIDDPWPSSWIYRARLRLPLQTEEPPYTKSPLCVCVCVCVYSVIFNSLWPHGLVHQVPLSVQGIFQARKLEWVAFSFCRGSSQLSDQTHITCISCIGR